jgi:hypothetical protein
MIQWILTILIVCSAAGIACYRLIRFFIVPPRHCDGCALEHGRCGLQELRQQVRAMKQE